MNLKVLNFGKSERTVWETGFVVVLVIAAAMKELFGFCRASV